MAPIYVSLDEIRAMATRTFDVLQSTGHRGFELPTGLYNFIHPADIWAVPVADAVAGDTRDDVETLRSELNEPDPAELSDWHSLQHFTCLLTVVASTITPRV